MAKKQCLSLSSGIYFQHQNIRYQGRKGGPQTHCSTFGSLLLECQQSQRIGWESEIPLRLWFLDQHRSYMWAMRPQLLLCLRKVCGRDQGAPKQWKRENEEQSNSSVVASFGATVLSRYRVSATWMGYILNAESAIWIGNKPHGGRHRFLLLGKFAYPHHFAVLQKTQRIV